MAPTNIGWNDFGVIALLIEDNNFVIPLNSSMNHARHDYGFTATGSANDIEVARFTRQRHASRQTYGCPAPQDILFVFCSYLAASRRSGKRPTVKPLRMSIGFTRI
nr:hypothetical protein [Brucella pseudogrignonensis]